MSDKVVSSLALAQSAVNELCHALDTLESVQEMLSSSGVDLADYEADIAADGRINQCNSSVYTFVINDVVPTCIIGGLKAYYSGTPTQQAFASLMKVRKL